MMVQNLKPEIKIVIGSLFGDEGKGNIVQHLCKEAISRGKSPCVIRFSGGPQCGHRVIHNKIEHVFSSFGSGSLLNVPTFYLNSPNVYIDPVSMVLEYKDLLSKGVSIMYPGIVGDGDKLIRHITFYDILKNLRDDKILKDGTCGKGLFTTFQRTNSFPKVNLENISQLYKIERDLERESIYKECLDIITHYREKSSIYDYNVWIFEGSQGLLLNFYSPTEGEHTTPSFITIDGITNNFKYLISDIKVDFYFVSRTYTTRHGNGYIPQYPEKLNTFFEDLDEPTNLDTGIQGIFKKGVLDVDLINIALISTKVFCFPDNYTVNMVFTHCDCLKEDILPIIDHNVVKIIRLSSIKKYLVDRIDNIIFCNSKEY